MGFRDCGEKPLGIYPIVDRAHKLIPLYARGITTAQIRIKDLQGASLEEEIRHAIALSEEAGARLFVNDYWQLAIAHGAYGVHLGQEDIQEANITALRETGLRLGVSSHTPEEIAIALALEPSYLAIGPVYPPLSKALVYPPIGPERFARWAAQAACPVVAIGGITHATITPILQTAAADGIAIVTDILTPQGEIDPRRVERLMELWQTHGRD